MTPYTNLFDILIIMQMIGYADSSITQVANRNQGQRLNEHASSTDMGKAARVEECKLIDQ